MAADWNLLSAPGIILSAVTSALHFPELLQTERQIALTFVVQYPYNISVYLIIHQTIHLNANHYYCNGYFSSNM